MRYSRIIWIASSLMLLLPASSMAGGARQSDFVEANAKYEAQDYKAASKSYEDLTHAGQETAAVYYNLGNAYFRLGQKGKALVSYERALAISPRDKDIRWNLEMLRSVLADRIETPSDNPVFFWGRKAADTFAINEISILLSALLLLFLAFAGLNFIFPRTKLWTSFFQFLTVAALVACAALFILKWAEGKDPRVVVLDKEVYAHYGPSGKETNAFLLHEGAEGKVLDETPDWFYIVLKNKNSGWIPKSSCETV